MARVERVYRRFSWLFWELLLCWEGKSEKIGYSEFAERLIQALFTL
jgi:hypothetical protein